MPAGSEVPRLARPHPPVTDRVRSGTLASMGTIEGLTPQSRGNGESLPSFLAWLVQQETLTPVLAERVARVLAETDEVDRLKDLASDAPVIRLVQRLIDEAVTSRASDIHLEPSEESLHVRLRVDGLLHELEAHPRDLAAPVVSRVKVMAGLN